ncbi:MAG: tetratricopeptide repeat protein [Candidatus Omnitrophica bacterium]|nr:tetratricopeptide repeat protein [Candidatus Omnitrophota bacterium]
MKRLLILPILASLWLWPVPAQTPDAEPTVNSDYNGNGGDLFIGHYVVEEVVHSETDEKRIRHRALIARGLMEIEEEKSSDALKTFQAALAADPESVVAMVSIAEICYNDDPVRAQDYLERAAQIDPDYYRLHYVKARLLRRLGKMDEMLEALNRTLELKPTHIEARQMRADDLVRRVDSEDAQRQAIEDFHYLQQMLPQRSPIWNFLIGRCYFNLKDYEHAVHYLEPLIGIPNTSDAAYLLGRAKQELGEYDEAINYLSRATNGHTPARESIAQIALMQAESATGEVRLKYLAQALSELKGLLNKPQYAGIPQKNLTAGKIAFELGQYDLAVTYLRRYLEKVPEDSEVSQLLLQSLLGTFDPSELDDVSLRFDKYAEGRSATDTAPMRFKYISYLMALGEWEKSEQQILDLQKTFPNDPRPAYLHAGVLVQNGSYEAAIDAANQALELTPENADEIQVLLGNAYLNSGSKELAAQAFEDAIASASDRYRALRCLEIGEFYRNQGMDHEGIQYWEMALNDKPDNEVLRYEIGRAYLQSGSLELAVPYFERVAENSKISENKSRAMTLLAYIKAVEGATQTAEEGYREAIETWPSNHFAHSGLAHLLADQDRFQEAKESYENAIALYDEDVSLIIQLGIVCDKLDDIKGAEDAAEKAMSVDPDYAEAYNFLGYMYAERGIKLDKAVELIEKALEIQPDDPNITDSLGWTYYQKGETEKAIQLLEKAVSLLTEEDLAGASVIYEHLGDAYEKAGRFDDAIEMWKKSVEGVPRSATAADKIEDLARRRSTTGKANPEESVGAGP